MYDMSRVNANGYFDMENTADDRFKKRVALSGQRTKDYACGTYERDGGVVETVTDDLPLFVKQYHAYYKTPRGYHRRSPNSNGGINKTAVLSFLSMPLLAYVDEICLSMGKMPIPAISVKMPVSVRPATTKNCSLFPGRTTVTSTTTSK